MPAKKNTSDNDKGWLATLWDWSQEVEADSGKRVQVSMYPTKRKGIWLITIRLLEVVDSKPAAIALQLSQEYPNGSAQGLTACLYSLLAGLDRMRADSTMP